MLTPPPPSRTQDHSRARRELGFPLTLTQGNETGSFLTAASGPRRIPLSLDPGSYFLGPNASLGSKTKAPPFQKELPGNKKTTPASLRGLVPFVSFPDKCRAGGTEKTWSGRDAGALKGRESTRC